jgi:hypothetical protein
LPWIKYFFQFTLPAFLISIKADAQQGKVKVKTETYSNDIKGDIEVVATPGVFPVPTEIIGKVIDDNGLPIPYATVIINETKKGVTTDSTGNFSIKSEYTDSVLTLTASCVGFQSFEKVIDLPKYVAGTNITINLTMSQRTLGEVVITATDGYRKGKFTVGFTSVVCTRTLKDTIVSLFNKFSVYSNPVINKFSVYPNPVTAGRSITVENKKLAADNYFIEIINLAGQTVHNELAGISGKEKLVLKTPFLIPGTYFLKLTGKNTRRIFSEKIIVE